jgi:hypothetical protein
MKQDLWPEDILVLLKIVLSSQLNLFRDEFCFLAVLLFVLCFHDFSVDITNQGNKKVQKDNQIEKNNEQPEYPSGPVTCDRFLL